MKRKFLYCFLLTVILLTAIGCRPKGILSSRQMEDLLVDLHTMESLLQENGYKYGHDNEARGYYLQLLADHHTSQAQFDSSLVWYTANPTIFDKIYPKVIERLQAQAEAYQLLMDNRDRQAKRTISDWLEQCQYGISYTYWPQKYKKNEKNAQKFVYVKKIL